MNPQNPFGQQQNEQNKSREPADPDQAKRSDQQSSIRNPLEVLQPGEQIICEVKRHPIGMLGTYVASGGLLILLAVLIFVLGPSIFSSSSHSQVMAGGGLIFILIAAMILTFVFIAHIIYWGNHWVVTDDSITQITQTSLFSKQSAQLSLGNLEDVTSEQNGILAQVFNFGVLKAETAGERSKFMFPYCPNPNYYAQKILAAREVFEREHHGGKQEPYVAPAMPMPSASQESVGASGSNSNQFFEQAAQQHQFGQTPLDYSSQAPPPSDVPSQQPPPGTSLVADDSDDNSGQAPTFPPPSA
jgi:hypothetical protein